MFCPNCGSQNSDNDKFCANCGTILTPETPAAPAEPATPVAPVEPAAPAEPVAPVAAAPVEPVKPVTPVKPAAPVAQAEDQSSETNGLCLAGFIVSLASIVLCGTTAIIGLILSIIGFAGAKKKNQKGQGMGLAGIIISAVLMVLFVLGIALYFGIYTSTINNAIPTTRKTTRETTEYTTEDITLFTFDDLTENTTEETTEYTTEETTEYTTEETTEFTTEATTEATTAETSESKDGRFLTSVGNEKTGTVELNDGGAWIDFYEAGGFGPETIEHKQASNMKTGTIIGLFVVDINATPDELGKSQMYVMEQAGAKGVTGARVKIGGYDAVQCYGTYPDGQILVCWYFKADDGYIRKVTVEFGQDHYSDFSLVEKNYKLDR